MCHMLSCVFFFQAEDGIRDLVRSRGLGDVYKRQEQQSVATQQIASDIENVAKVTKESSSGAHESAKAVSYTHLTLPTSDLV